MLRRRYLPSLLVGLALALVGCSPQPPSDTPEPESSPTPIEPAEEPDPSPAPEDDHAGDPQDAGDDAADDGVGAYGVSAGDGDAVEAGMAVLEAGGNAVDAAIAAAFAVSVVEPFASGIGGGGAAIVAEPGERPVAYDYREVVAADGRIPDTNTGIPGFVAGMAEMHDRHGDQDLAALLEPAIALARDGTETSAILSAQLRSAAHRMPVGQLPHLYPGGVGLTEGEQLQQGELADTLEQLADAGLETFYRGDLATTLSDRVDGIDPDSLATYEVQGSPPPSGSFAGYEVVTAAPPLPGVTLIQMLQVAESLGIEDHPPGSADFIHAISMAWRLADHVVSSELGDPSFVEVPVEALTDANRNAALAEQVPMDGPLADPDAVDPTAGNTTHLTVVDANGGMVSMTNTLTNFWGSGQYELGFFLNDQLRRFSIGVGAANEPEPGRRSVSWSLPAMVLDQDGRPVLGLGAPGGRRIPNVLTQVLVRWGSHGQPLEEAVDAPRFHLENSDLELELLPPADVADDLRARGYSSLTVPDLPYYFGSVQALEIDRDGNRLLGARDARRDADWAVQR